MAINRQARSLCWVTLLVVLTVYPNSSRGQHKAAPQRQKLPDKILTFLRAMEPRVLFWGKVITLPEGLRQSLEHQFYLHRFTIVSLERSLDISYRENEMIIVTDAKSGEVVSALWELGVGGLPQSFIELPTHYTEPEDWQGATARIKTLGDLLVYPDRDDERFIGSRVGSIWYNEKEKTFNAELIKSYTPYCLLQVKVEEVGGRYKFGRLSFIKPVN